MQVDKARQRLIQIDADALKAIRSKQAARMVLSKEAEMVKNLVAEGLLTTKNAEEFLEQITNDTANIERERNLMHRYSTPGLS